MGGTCGVAREREGPQGASFYFVSSLGSLHLEGSVFICNILSMGCISSVLISRKIDSCFPGDGVGIAWYGVVIDLTNDRQPLYDQVLTK